MRRKIYINKVAEKLDEIVFSVKKFVQEISVIDYQQAAEKYILKFCCEKNFLKVAMRKADKE
ncbi:MAG: hypothetical protein IJ797_10360 [Selenomonadaceae bacterium]|nr:hypothetical protein [Selenomonadaceae bacterium]